MTTGAASMPAPLGRRRFIEAALLCTGGLLSGCGAGIMGRGGSTIVDVRRFGAKGDGRRIDSPAINAAIDHAAARGGGTVWLPAGTYLSYSLRLRSNITLHLDAGAILLAASVPREGVASGGYDRSEDVPEAYRRYQDYGHRNWRNALIWGEGLENVAIEGAGLIWGRGLSRGHETDLNLPIAGRPGVGDKSIALKLCRNVRLRDFRMLQAGWFGLLATGVDNLTIDNLLIDTNRDGLDIDCCRNVHVTNCTVNSPWDDAICPKSSFALGYARPTENVTISGCTVSGSYQVGSVLDGTFRPFVKVAKSTHGRIKLGTESNGGFRNIAISNCVFDRCRGIALETVDGAMLEDVSITNVVMRGVTTAPVFLRLGARLRGPAGSRPGTLKRVIIQGVTSSAADALPSLIAGLPDAPVEDVSISDCHFEQVGGGSPAMAALEPPEKPAGYPEADMFGDLPASGWFIRHARGIDMANVEIATLAPDARPALWLQDVGDFAARGLRLPRGPAFSLRDVRGFRVADSRSLPDLSLAEVRSRLL